jgi:hypothetical protein
MPGTPFSHANLTETAHALYGRSWERALARDLNIPLRTVKSQCLIFAPVSPIYADSAASRDPNMLKLARKLESLGPPG